jgi:hypothetical protein
VLWESCHEQADHSFWAHSVPIEMGGIQTRALGPADQLLHVCVHGARWTPLPPLRWVADALLVMRRAGDALDWGYFLEQAQRLRVTLPLRDTLSYLRQHFATDIPAGVVAALAASTTERIDRQFYRLKAMAPGFLGGLPLTYYHYRVLAAGAGLRVTPSGFWRHLQATWGLARPASVVSAGVRRILGRVAWLVGTAKAPPW